MTTHPGYAADAQSTHRDGELPERGRVVESLRKVRMSDVGADRRARLDSLARYLHDVAEDDAAGATLPSTIGWVLRSTRIDIGRFPSLGEELTLRTFCSATASRWAERTTVAHGSEGAQFRAVSIWVAVDTETGAPARLGDWFFSIYGPSASGRHASARLALSAPDPMVARAARPWPLRRSDFDAWGHVNNAIAWAAVEDSVDVRGVDSLLALLEHHAPIDPGAKPLLAAERKDNEWSVWLLEPGEPGQVLMVSKIVLPPANA